MGYFQFQTIDFLALIDDMNILYFYCSRDRGLKIELGLGLGPVSLLW